MDEPQNNVWVSRSEVADAVPAQAEPTFLVKLGDVYYLTQAVWEYDASAPGLTEEQVDACRDTKLFFDGVTPKLEAVQVPFPRPAGGAAFGNQTKK